MESFFSSLKTERTARKTYRTRDEAKADVFDYIERFYNPKATALDAGLSQSDGVRNECQISLSWRQPNRQQPKSVQFRKETPWFSRRITVYNAPIATV